MKVVKWALLAFVLVLVAVPLSAYVRNKLIGPVGWAQDDAERLLRQRVKDPGSMVIRSSFAVAAPDGSIAICGIVDAKNSFGGYTGGVRFVSQSLALSGSFTHIGLQLEDAAETRAARQVNRLSGFEEVYWNGSCVDEAHPPLTP
jgi:hypothetical protein